MCKKEVRPNPLIKAVFDRVQFPIRYNFLQNQQTGVVNRTFGTRLGDPLSGSCQDASGNSYPRVYTTSEWDGVTVSSCFDFCKSLPGFDNHQVGLNIFISYCYCFYEDGSVPPAGELPTGAIPSSS